MMPKLFPSSLVLRLDWSRGAHQHWMVPGRDLAVHVGIARHWPGINSSIRFSASLMVGQNKLECLCLDFFFLA